MVNQNENYINNLKTTLELAKSAYQDSLNRIKNVELKLNILLVFCAGLLAGLNVIVPFSENISRYIVALLICFLINILISIICLFIGLFTNKFIVIDSRAFIDEKLIESQEEIFLRGYIEAYHKGIVSIEEHKLIKNIMFIISFICSLISLLFFSIIIIIRISF